MTANASALPRPGPHAGSQSCRPICDEGAVSGPMVSATDVREIEDELRDTTIRMTNVEGCTMTEDL